MTGIVAIIGIARKLVQLIDKLIKWIEQQDTDHMNILKLVIMSPYMPLNERIGAGDEYVSRGGNGGVKQTYLLLLDEVREQQKENERKGG